MRLFASKKARTVVISVSLLFGLSPNTNAQDVNQFEEYYVRIVGDSNQPPSERTKSARQLAKIRPPAKKSVPALLEAFQFNEEIVVHFGQGKNYDGLELRRAALQTLIAIRPDAKQFVPVLVGSLKHIKRGYEDVLIYLPPGDYERVDDIEPRGVRSPQSHDLCGDFG